MATLRSADAGLQTTRALREWLSTAPSHLSGGVRPSHWYRLHVVVVGCRLVAEALNPETGATAYSGIEDRNETCLPRGGILLRTSATAAAWKNIRVQAAAEQDYAALATHLSGAALPEFPIHERAYTSMRERYLANVPTSEQIRPIGIGGFGDMQSFGDPPLVSIADLRSQVWEQKPVRIAGVITSSSPLYIEDPGAGIAMKPFPGASLRAGDEVEVIGKPSLHGEALQFTPLAGRFLSDGAPLVALSITAAQAASGRYEGSLIELSGTLRESKRLPDGEMELHMEEGAQRFTVRVPYDLFQADTRRFEVNSRLRVRGVCSVEAATGNGTGSFLVYTNSGANITLLEGPPWWSGQRLLFLILAAFLLLVGGILLYGVAERSRLRALQQERESLSHEMHDALAQSLAGVGFRLQGIHRELRQSKSAAPELVDDLKHTADLLAQTHREASANIAAMHPASQKEGDLLTLLERAVYSMVDDEEFPVIVSSHGNARPLSPAILDTLYRVGREAIANALRHSAAKSIRVQLLYRSRDVVLSVTDDGEGFAMEPGREGFGIRSMMRRCEAIKAKMTITSPPEGGCRVQLTAPYRMHRGLVRWVG